MRSKAKGSNRVLITGAAGFIGSNLLDLLMDETDWLIDGVDDLSTGAEENIAAHRHNPRFRFIRAGCRELDSVKKYSKIFHLAALPRIQPSFELITEHIDANLVAAMHLVQLMIRENHFPRFVFSGSSAIYGTPGRVPTTEMEPADCLSPYAFQKYEVEKYLELIASRYPLDYVVMRYFNVYGPRSFNPRNKFNAYSSVIGIFLNRRREGEKLQVTGDGKQKRDFVHVHDVARANYLASTHPGKHNTAYNIGNGSTISIFELAKIISADYEFIPVREGESEVTWADNSKALRGLGWKPSISLSEYLSQNITV